MLWRRLCPAGQAWLWLTVRLATLQKSDKLTVIENGKTIEEESHNQQLAQGERARYFSLSNWSISSLIFLLFSSVYQFLSKTFRLEILMLIGK